MWRNLVNTGIVCLLLGGTVSCGRTDVYNEFNTLPKNGWFKRDVQRFTPEVPDTVNRYDVYLSLRHNGDYTYRNLWLFVSYNDEGGVLKTDTVNCELADEFGRWSGGGWGSYYQQAVLLNMSSLCNKLCGTIVSEEFPTWGFVSFLMKKNNTKSKHNDSVENPWGIGLNFRDEFFVNNHISD